MLSLLALSLALSTPVSAGVQAPASQTNSSAVRSQLFVSAEPTTPASIGDDPGRSFDQMAIHPASDVCYKIRAYIFTKGQNPTFVRETTCSPSRAAAKQTNKDKAGRTPQQ